MSHVCLNRIPRLLAPLKKQNNPSLRIICFPYAGGNASLFRSWLQYYCEDVEIISIHLPGRGARILDPLYACMDLLIADLMQEVVPLVSQPYILMGHSFGSKIAYELARQIQHQQLPLPHHFIASAGSAPHLPIDRKLTHDLSDTELIAELTAMGGTPSEILENVELMSILLPGIRADIRIAELYRTQMEPLNCPISVFGGIGDNSVSWKALEGWGQLSNVKFELELLEGGHFFIAEHDLLALRVRVIVEEILKKIV